MLSEDSKGRFNLVCGGCLACHAGPLVGDREAIVKATEEEGWEHESPLGVLTWCLACSASRRHVKRQGHGRGNRHRRR